MGNNILFKILLKQHRLTWTNASQSACEEAKKEELIEN